RLRRTVVGSVVGLIQTRPRVRPRPLQPVYRPAHASTVVSTLLSTLRMSLTFSPSWYATTGVWCLLPSHAPVVLSFWPVSSFQTVSLPSSKPPLLQLKTPRAIREPQGGSVIRLRVPRSAVSAKQAQYKERGKPARRPELLNHDDHVIISTYGSEYR